MAKGIPPLVRNFVAVMISKLTRYDQRLAAKERYPNIYRIGHYLGAAHKVEADLGDHGFKGDEIVTAENASLLKKIFRSRFTTHPITGESDFPPIKAVIKQIDDYVTKGKNPSLIG